MIWHPVEYLHECFECDAEAGILTWKVRPRSHFSDSCHHDEFSRRYAGKTAGGRHRTGYWDVYLDGQKVRAHRIIWAMHTGAWPVECIDHVNRARSDNRICNLREATPSQNAKNRAATNRLGLKGVYSAGKKFRALIQIDQLTQINLGLFDTAEMAHAAYSVAAQTFHGEFAGGIS